MTTCASTCAVLGFLRPAGLAHYQSMQRLLFIWRKKSWGILIFWKTFIARLVWFLFHLLRWRWHDRTEYWLGGLSGACGAICFAGLVLAPYICVVALQSVYTVCAGSEEMCSKQKKCIYLLLAETAALQNWLKIWLFACGISRNISPLVVKQFLWMSLAFYN